MKSTVSETPCEADEIEYPCLMRHKHSKIIILFWQDRVGVLVQDDDGYTGFPIGHYSDNWSKEKEYELFHGSVCLEN